MSAVVPLEGRLTVCPALVVVDLRGRGIVCCGGYWLS